MRQITRPMLRLCRHHPWLSWQQNNYSTKHQVAIVGSGPAGYYTAKQILKGNDSVSVDIYEKLPVPFGLVRFGVAPDHQDVKNVINTFTQTASNNRCHFLGNVHVGRDVTIKQLADAYSAVILAYGAEEERTLGVPGELLQGVLSARQFVGWYNGLPEHQNLNVDLSKTSSVCVLGHGNVALDVARILLTPIDILKTTDLTARSISCLASSQVKDVYLVGRRGPLQVAFTTAEVREMTKLPGCKPQIAQQAFRDYEHHIAELARPKKRLVELLRKSSTSEPVQRNGSRLWHVMFQRTPTSFVANPENHVQSVNFVQNKLEGDDPLTQRAVATDNSYSLDTQLVVKSIGYKSVCIDPDIPFDPSKCVVPNIDGRVTGYPGLYCSGWIKRGPVGVIVSTMTDSFQTGNVVVQDIAENKLDSVKPGRQYVQDILQKRGVHVVTFEGWKRIDAEETKRGVALGKPREKITDIREMLEIAVH